MCTSHKKALQPPHPSEPVVGQFFRNLPCQRCIPLYPLRYAISDKPVDAQALPQLDTSNYPKLSGPLHYGLRVLRPGCYVYLFYFRQGRMWTQHYQVTEEGRFAALWWSLKDHDDTTPGRHARPDVAGATPYIPAPETPIADTVWLQVSDTLLSHCMLWKIEQDAEALRSMLATPFKPADGPTQPHTLPSDQLKDHVTELALTHQHVLQQRSMKWMMFPTPHPLHWSEHQHTPLSGLAINAAMHTALMNRSDIVPTALVVQDSIGIVSELNHLATCAVQERARFAADNAHQLTSAQLINSYFQQDHPPQHAEDLARQKRLVQWAQLQHFPGAYAKRLAALDIPVEHAANDVAAWIKLSPALASALSCFDLEDLSNARDFEETVFHCIGALVHSHAGREVFEQLVELPPDQSVYWKAIAQGNPIILARLKQTAEVSKGVFDVLNKYLEEHAATPVTNALVSLLQALPAAKKADVLVRRLRHVLEFRFDATLIEHSIGATQYLRYARELQGHQVLGPELLDRWGLSIGTAAPLDTDTVRITFYEWVKVGETEYRELGDALPPKRVMPLQGNPLLKQLEKLRGPTGHLFTGLGGVAAVLGMWSSSKELSISEPTTMIALAGATGTLIGAGIEIGATGFAVIAGEKNVKAKAAKIFGAKLGIATLGAGGAALFTMADVFKATNSLREFNPEQSRLYFGAALAGGALTLTTWAGGTATALAFKAGTTGVVFLGLTPAGWAVLTLLAIGTSIYFSVKADDAGHGPLDTWLKHSIWGVHAQQYNHQEELEALYSLIYRPRLSANWNKSFGSLVGRLDIDCNLPTPMKSERFSWILQVTLKGKLLTAVNAPIAHAHQHHGIDYQRQYLIRHELATGSQRGWKITMHEDAQVALEYIFHPNFDEQPDLALTQPGAPTPLIFTSGNWINDPIDKKLLAPVTSPQ